MPGGVDRGVDPQASAGIEVRDAAVFEHDIDPRDLGGEHNVGMFDERSHDASTL